MFRPVPFPLAAGRYEIGPGLRRFGQAGQGMPAEQGHFHPDGGLAATLSAKLAVLQRAPGECHLAEPETADGSGLRAALRECFVLLAAEHPDLAQIYDNGVTLPHLGLRLANWSAPAPRLEPAGAPRSDLAAVAAAVREWLAGQTGLWLLGNALALSVQEDLAIQRGPTGLLEWLHVCLPSGWAPAKKIGRPFGVVHRPVAHSEPLVAGEAQLVRAMTHAGPFVRYVWGIHRDGALCHHPRLHQSPPWRAAASPAELARQAFFRVERQTTRGLPHLGRALFTIRYWVEPLTETAADPWRRERLRSALLGMDAAELAYKGLTEARDRLTAWLATPGAV